MKISIVTPSYNQAAYLEQTICSVLEQDYADIEYLVIDGGSTDGSVDIIRRYADRLAYWVSEKDQGQADAVNKGLARASGDILAWINSDDIYWPGAFRSAAAVFEQNPEVVLAYGDVASLNSAGEQIHRQRYGGWNLDDLMKFRILGQPSVFFRRTAFEKAGPLNERYHYLLDHNLWLRIASYGQMRYVPEIWSGARFHMDAKNVALASAFGQDALSILEWMPSEPLLSEKYQKHQKEIRAGGYWFNARYLSAGGQPAEAVKEYWRSFQLNPAPVMRDWKRVLGTVLALTGIDVFRKYS